MHKLYEMILNGFRPTIEFNGDIMDQDGADPGMRGVITGILNRHHEILEIMVDINPFMDHNKAIAKAEWYDKDEKPTLTWFQTSYYPKNGVWKFYVDPNEKYPIPFMVLEDKAKKLMEMYTAEKSSLTYVQWLESKINL